MTLACNAPSALVLLLYFFLTGCVSNLRRCVASETRSLHFDSMMTDKRTLCIRSPFVLWRCVPCGFVDLTFRTDENGAPIHVSCHTAVCCWCCCEPQQLSLDSTVAVAKQPLCNGWRLLRDTGASFVLAFLFHLIPSVLWGAARSLGSPRNHALMGVVWFAGWPVFFAILQLLRPWGLQLSPRAASARFVPFQSRAHAAAVAAWWMSRRDGKAGVAAQPPTRWTMCNAWLVLGLLLWAVLWANALYTGVEVAACSGRGCCRDNATTLECCVATGYPNATSCGP